MSGVQIVVAVVGVLILYLLVALVGTAAGWWDWLGLISGDDER